MSENVTKIRDVDDGSVVGEGGFSIGEVPIPTTLTEREDLGNRIIDIIREEIKGYRVTCSNVSIGLTRSFDFFIDLGYKIFGESSPSQLESFLRGMQCPGCKVLGFNIESCDLQEVAEMIREVIVDIEVKDRSYTMGEIDCRKIAIELRDRLSSLIYNRRKNRHEDLRNCTLVFIPLSLDEEVKYPHGNAQRSRCKMRGVKFRGRLFVILSE